MWFRHTVQKNNIKNFIEYNEWKEPDIVKKIQKLKEDSMTRLVKSFSQEKIKFIDPMLIKWVEKDYFDLIKENDNKIDNNFDYGKQQKEIEMMFKKNSFEEDYIWKFEKESENNLIETPIWKLINRRDELYKIKPKSNREIKELTKIKNTLKLLDNRNLQNTKSRTILFDENEFKTLDDKFNVQCFYEQDKQWNKNYFSVNELLNDLETFGVESGYPKIKVDSLGKFEKKFATVQKFVKVALLKNILAKYRDYQEVVMYGFYDNEKHKWERWHDSKTWILAEKVVEWSFRDYANLDDKYKVNIKKASIWEDQAHKVDLIIQIQDKKTWINIEKELQLTVNNEENILKHKREQIAKQKIRRDTNLDLVTLELGWLTQKVTLWRNMDRPIWGLNDLLSIEDKEFLKKTYNRIVEKLDEKVLQEVEVKKLSMYDNKSIAA